MPIYIYKGNSQISTNAIRNNKAVKAIYAKEQGQEAVCVWGVNLNILPFTYTKSETSITITGLKNGVMMKHLRVPETIEDLPVTQIDREAFRENTRLEYIRLSDSLEKIGTNAFYDCTGLTSITIPDSLTDIGIHTFYGCNNLQDIYITDIAAWCNISGLADLMRYNSDNKNLYINNELVTSITIPNSVTNIGGYAFYKCKGLTSITIPDSVTSIGASAFMYCTGLTNITIPNSVTSIGDEAFAYCSGITSITIPNGVTIIRSATFRNCTGLTSVTIPSSVTNIKTFAFYSCSSLTSITFTGTIAQWRAIPKGERWNEKAGDYTVHCTDGDTNV